MPTAAELLLPHYRDALDEAKRAHRELGPAPDDPRLIAEWVRAGELTGRIGPAEAIRLRRLADKVRFYEGRSAG